MKLIFIASILIALLSALTIVAAQFEPEYSPEDDSPPDVNPPPIYSPIGEGRRNEKCKPPGCIIDYLN